MVEIGKILIFTGFAAGLIAQLIGMVLIFATSPIQGILSLIIPGYIFLALKEHGYYYKVVGLWLIGVIAIVVGVVIVS